MSSQTPGFKAINEPFGNLKANIHSRLNQIRLPNFHTGSSKSNKPPTILSQTADELPYPTGTDQPLVALNVPQGTYIEQEIDKLIQGKEPDEKNVSSASYGGENIFKYKVTVSIPQQPELEGKNSSDRFRVILSIAEDKTTKPPNREQLSVTTSEFQTQLNEDSKTVMAPVFPLDNRFQENDSNWRSEVTNFHTALDKTQEKPPKEKKYWFIPRHELDIASGDSLKAKDTEFNNKIPYERKHAGRKLKTGKGGDSLKAQDIQFNSSVGFKKNPVGSKLKTNKYAVLKVNPTVLDFLKTSWRNSKENYPDQTAAITANSWQNSTVPQVPGDVLVHANLTLTERPIGAQIPTQKAKKKQKFSGYSQQFLPKTAHLKPQHFELEGVDKKGEKIRIVNNAFPVIITMQNSSNDNYIARLGDSSKRKDEGDNTYSVPVSVIIDRVPLNEVLKTEQLSSSHLDNSSSPEMMKKSVEHWNSMIENLETVSDMFNENFTNPCSIVCNSENCSIMPCLRVLQLMPQVYNSLFQNGQDKTNNLKLQHNSDLKVYTNGANSSLPDTTKNVQQVHAPQANTAFQPNELISEGNILKSEARYRVIPNSTYNAQLVKAPIGSAVSESSGLIAEGHMFESKPRYKELPDSTKNMQLVKAPEASNTTESSELILEGNILQSENRNKEILDGETVIDNKSVVEPTGIHTPETSLMLEPAPIYLPLANEFQTDSRKNIYQPSQNQLRNESFVNQNPEISATNTSPFGAHINEVNPALFSLQQPARSNFPKVELTMQNTVGDGSNLKQKVMPFDYLQNLNEINDGKKPPSSAYSMDSQSNDYVDDFDDTITRLESSSAATSIASTCYPPAWFSSTRLNFSPLTARNSDNKNPSQRLPTENPLRYSAIDTNQNQGDCTQRASFQPPNNVPFFNRLPWDTKRQNVQNKDPLTGGLKAPQSSSYSPLPITNQQSLPKLQFTYPDNVEFSKNASVFFTNKIFVTTIAPSTDQPRKQKVKVENDVSELILWMPENIPKINFVFKQKNQKPTNLIGNNLNTINLRRTARSYDHSFDVPYSFDLKSRILKNQNNFLAKEASENKLTDNRRNVHFSTDEKQLIDTETAPFIKNELMGLSSFVADNFFFNGGSNDDMDEESHSQHFSLRHSASCKNDSRKHKKHGKKRHRHHRKSKKNRMNRTDEQQNDHREQHTIQSQQCRQKVVSSIENDSTETPLIVNLEEPLKVKEGEDKNKKPRHHKKHRKKHFKKHLRRPHFGSKNESISVDKKQNTTTNDRFDIISELWQRNLTKGKRLMEYFKHLKSPISSEKKAQHAEKVGENSTLVQKTDWIRNEIPSKNNSEELKKRTMSTVRFLENTTFLFDEDEVMNVNSNAFIKNNIKSNFKSKTKNKNLVDVALDEKSTKTEVKGISTKCSSKFFADSHLKTNNDSESNYSTLNSEQMSSENERSDLEDRKTGTYTDDQTEGKNFFGSAALSSANITDDRSDEKTMPLFSYDQSTNSTEALKTDEPKFESTSSGTFQLLKRFMKGRVDGRGQVTGNTSHLEIKTEQTFNNVKEISNANVTNSFLENNDKKEVKESMSKSAAKGSGLHVGTDKSRDQTIESTNITTAHGLESSTDLETKVKSKNFFKNFPSRSTENGTDNDVGETQHEKHSDIKMNSTKKKLFPRLHFFKSLSGSNNNNKQVKKNKNHSSKKGNHVRKKICVHVHGAPPLKLDNTKVYHAVKIPSAVITPYVAEAFSGIKVRPSNTSMLLRENKDRENQIKKTLAHSGDEETQSLNQKDNENISGRADEETIKPIEDKNFGKVTRLDQKLKDSQAEGNSETWIDEKKERVVQNNLMGSGNFIDAKIYPFFPYKVPDLYAMRLAKGDDNNENFMIPLDTNRQSSANDMNLQPTERNKFTCKNYNTPFDKATNIYIYPELKRKNQDSMLNPSAEYLAAQLKKYDRQLLEKMRQLGLADPLLAQNTLVGVSTEKEPESATLSASGVNALKQFIALLNKEKDRGYIQQLIKSINKKQSAEESFSNSWQQKSQKKFVSAHRQLEEILRKSEKEKDSWKELKKCYLDSLRNQLTSHTTCTSTTPSSFDKHTTMSLTDQILNTETESPHIRICSPEWKNSTYAEVCTDIPICEKRLELKSKQPCTETRTSPTFLFDKVTIMSDQNPSISKCNTFSSTSPPSFLFPENQLPMQENFLANNPSTTIIPREETIATTANPLLILETLRCETAVTKPLLQSGDRKTQLDVYTTESSISQLSFNSEPSNFNLSKLLADLQYTAGKFATENERPPKLLLPSGILSKKETEMKGLKNKDPVLCFKIKSVTEASRASSEMDETPNETIRGEFTSPRISSMPDCKSLIEGGLSAMANATLILDKLRQLQINSTHHDTLEPQDQNSEATQICVGQSQDKQTYSLTKSSFLESTLCPSQNLISSIPQISVNKSGDVGKTWNTHIAPESKEKNFQNSVSDGKLSQRDENIERKLNSLRRGFAVGKHTGTSSCNERTTRFEDIKSTELSLVNWNEIKDSLMKNESLNITSLNVETHNMDEHKKDNADRFETPTSKGSADSHIKYSKPSKETRFTIVTDMMEEKHEKPTLKKSEYIVTPKTAEIKYYNADGKNSNQKICDKTSVKTLPTINGAMKTEELMNKLNIKTDIMTSSTMSKDAQEDETVTNPCSTRLYFTTEGTPSSSLCNTFSPKFSVSKLVNRTQKNDQHCGTPDLYFAEDKIQPDTLIMHGLKFSSSTTELKPSGTEVTTKNIDDKINFKIEEKSERRNTLNKNQKIQKDSVPATSIMDTKPQNEVILLSQNMSDNKMHLYQPKEANSKYSSTNPDFHALSDSGETIKGRKMAGKSIHTATTSAPSTAEQFLDKSNIGNVASKTISNRKDSSYNPASFKDIMTTANNQPIVFKSVYKRIDNSGSSTMKIAMSEKSLSVKVKVCQTPPGTTIRCSTVKYNSGEINATKDKDEGKGTRSTGQCSTATSNSVSSKTLDRGDHNEIDATLLPAKGDISKVNRLNATETVLPCTSTQCITMEKNSTTAKRSSSTENRDGSKFLTTLARRLKSTKVLWQEKKFKGPKKSKEGGPTVACPVPIMRTTLQDSTVSAASQDSVTASENEPQKLTITPARVTQLSTTCDCISSTRGNNETQILEEEINERVASKKPSRENVNLTESESSSSRQGDEEDKKKCTVRTDNARATEKSEIEDSPIWLEREGMEEQDGDFINFKEDSNIENSENNTNVFDASITI